MTAATLEAAERDEGTSVPEPCRYRDGIILTHSDRQTR